MPAPLEILHYVGADDDRGGIISVVRNLASTGQFGCVLGLNPGGVQHRQPPLPALELPSVAGENISLRNFLRARTVARAVAVWLRADGRRIFHGHSRAGLLVGLWLHWMGARRVVVSVHCYGRQRWFYRWAARQLGGRLYWLSPAMKEYYGVGDGGWAQCVPGCVAAAPAGPRVPREGNTIRLAGVGALVRWKNWGLVLSALQLLPEETRRRFSFRHIGADDGSADSRAYATELRVRSVAPELQGVVEWCGPQSSSAALLAETDCLVVASHNEPFSVAMLEALQAGVPVLAADSGGARDVARPGANGWLYASGRADALAQQLARFTGTNTLAEATGDPGIVQRFAAPGVAAQWTEIYARVAKA